MSPKEPEGKFEERLGAALGRTAGLVFRVPLGLLEQGAQTVGLLQHKVQVKPGARPGIDLDAHVAPPSPTERPEIVVMDYDGEGIDVREIEDLDAFLESPEPARTVRWIDVAGIELSTVTRLAKAYGIHPLLAEDIMHTPQRPKLDVHGETSFILVRMLRIEKGDLIDEQVSFFVRAGLVITFQQARGDVWDRVRARLKRKRSPIRSEDAGYLTYALVDAIVDHGFPVLEHYGDRLEALENRLLTEASPELALRIHGVKRELMLLRRVLWPMREVIVELRDEQPPWMDDRTHTHMKDVYDHAVRVLEMVEMFRELAGGLNDLHMSQQSHRMNEVMKVLTVMASVFIPITFIAGVYGMNFENMPELHWRYGYHAAWAAFVCVTLALLGYFRYRRWI